MSTTKVYIASLAENRAIIPAVEHLLKTLCQTHLEFTSTWYNEENYIDPKSDRQHYISADFYNGVAIADLVLVLYPYGPQGTISELAYALGLGKIVIYVRSYIDEDNDPTITHNFIRLKSTYMPPKSFYIQNILGEDSIKHQLWGIVTDAILKVPGIIDTLCS